MIYTTLLCRLRKHLHKKSCRTFALLLMMTACLFFAGRQGSISLTAKAAGHVSEGFIGGGAKEGFSDDGGQPENSTEKVQENEPDQIQEAEESSEEASEKIVENTEESNEDSDDGSEGFSTESESSEEDSEDSDSEEQTESTTEETASQGAVPVRIVLNGQKRYKAGSYYFYANKNFDALLFSTSEKEEGSGLLSGADFVSTFITDGSSLYYFTSRGLTRYSIDSRAAELIMPLETGELVTPYILQVYEGKYYYTIYESDTNSVFYCYDSSDGKVSTIAEDRLAPNLYSGAQGRYMLLMSTDFSRTYLYDSSSGQTHEVGQGSVNACFWNDKLYVSQIDNYEGGSVHLSAYTLPDLKVVKAITIGENILTNSFADGYFYYSYGKQDDQGNLKEEYYVRIDPLTGDQKAISKEECNLALYNQKEPGNN